MDLNITRRHATAMLLAAFGSSFRSAHADDPAPLRIAHDLPIAWLPLFVAYDRKLWQSEGIAPTTIPSPHGTATLISVAGGAADIGVSTEMSVCVGAFSKTPVKIIACFNQVANMELACSTAIRSPADLKGKRIAVVQANPSQYYFSLLLKKYSFSPSDVSLVRLGPAEMLSALAGGSIDGFVWQEPFLSQAAKVEGKKFHRLSEPGLNKIFASIIVNEKTLRERRPVLVKALRALDRACAFVRSNAEESVRIGAQFSQMDADVAADAISRMQIGLSLDAPVMKAKMTDEANWALAEGIARPSSAIPDYSDYLDATVLADARRS
jgi:ABC-type nitrate/sulfonate/bicarbonate transport system substrate-binding protein